MDLPYRSEMESGFGVSFGGVSVYGGGAAAEASRSLSAEAYTVGQQIAFKDSSPPKEIVAHELAHTIQQGSAGPVQTWAEGQAGDSFEQEADVAAATVLAGGKATVAQRTGATISKWGGEDHYTIGNLAGQKALQKVQALDIADPGVPAVRVVGPEGTGVQRPDATTGNAAGAGANEPNRVASSGTGITTSENQRTMGIRTNEGVISMGAASRYSGDYATTVNGIGGLTGRSDELSGGGAARRGGSQWANLYQFAQMTIGGTTNANHFYPVNGMEYRGHHAKAMSKANRAWALSQAGDQAAAQTAINEAMQEEGFANHFLQDTFSSGHMAPRSLDSTEHLTSDKDALAVAMNNTANNVDTTVGRAGTAVGRAAGNVTGLFSGIWNRVSNLQNPFSAEGRASIAQEMNRQANNTGTRWGNTAERASNAVTGTFQTGGIVHSVVRGAEQLSGFASDAYQGLVRTKQWHDFFCSIPNGLPTNMGNFHGDHFMDGNDLEVVSENASNSIAQVLAAAHGKHANGDVRTPTPNFSAIMADPMAGPAWRMMMSDYQQSLRAARAQIDQNPNATGTTDGGTQFSSSEVLNLIQQNVFGGGDGALPTAEQTRAQSMAQAQIDPGGTLTTKFRYIKGSFDGIHHYLTTEFGFNKNLAGGQGLDDNLNRPVDTNRNDGSAQDHETNRDWVSDAGTGPAFDPCQLEGRWRMVSTLQQQINDYTAALTACMSNASFSTQHQAQLQTQLAQCSAMTATANTWKSRLDALQNAGSLNFDSLPIGVPGGDANQVAWGAGHPEWLSNHRERRAYREEMAGQCVGWRQRLNEAPMWGEASGGDTAGGGEPAPPPTPGP